MVVKSERTTAPKYFPITNSNLLNGLEIRVNKDLLSSSSWMDPQLDNKNKVKRNNNTVEKQVSVAKRSSSPKANREQSGENQIKNPKNKSKM